jgi:LysR family transcriptional regulator, nitrogen assimilation regulatory protein
MDLRALRSFQYVAELNSFTRAALHLRVAQPAVSRHIQKLERDIGVDLFVRRGRDIELTQAGAVLLQRTRLLLGQIDQLVDEVRVQATEVTGTVVVGAPPTIGDKALPSLFRHCSRQYPGLTLEIVESASPGLYDMLRGKEVSIALLHNPRPHPDLVIVPLLVDQLYLIGPGHRINGLDPVRKSYDLEALPMILPRVPHNRRMVIDEVCLRHGINLNVRMHVDGFTIIRALVEEGFGYSMLSYYGIHNEVETGRLSAVRLRNPSVDWNLSIGYRHDLRNSRPLQAVLRILHNTMRKLVKGDAWWGTPRWISTDADGEAS